MPIKKKNDPLAEAASIANELGARKELPAPALSVSKKEVVSAPQKVRPVEKPIEKKTVPAEVKTQKTTVPTKPHKWAFKGKEVSKKSSTKRWAFIKKAILPKNTSNKSVLKPKDGEKIITKVLNNLKLKYSKKVKLPQLKEDKKKYRHADYYLPEYGFYIEYFNGWDSPVLKDKVREGYIEKKNVYEKNNIPCLYLYPADIDRIEELIQKKIAQVLLAKSVPLLQTKKGETTVVTTVVEKKVMVPVKKKIVVEESSTNLEDVANSLAAREETNTDQRNEDREPIEQPFHPQDGGLIEVLGGIAMIIIGLEVLAIILVLIFLFFFK